MKGEGTWEAHALLTIRDRLPSRDARFVNQEFQPVGALDGLGAYQLNQDTVRVLVNHELEGKAGYPYRLDNGTTLTGARISFLDIDRRTLQVLDGGIAYRAIRDRQGRIVETGFQINEVAQTEQGLSRLCSSQLLEKDTFNFVDTIYLTTEELSDPLGHPYGGTVWALDVERQTLHAVPAMGRMAGENTTPLSGPQNAVALLIGNDAIPQTVEAGGAVREAGPRTSLDHVVTAPLWLYVGKKNAPVVERALPLDIDPDNASFLNRNGLLAGQLYYFVADQGVRTVAQFNGTGSTLTGAWKAIDVLDRTKAGEKGYDPMGYKTGLTLRREAKAGGAFQFSRPEDVSTHPAIGTRAVLASTGRDTVFPDHDAWGTIYQIDVDFEAMTATLKILYDGDDAGGARFSHPDEGIRNPDNLEWGKDGWIYIQEDNAKQQAPLFGSHSGEESSLWRLDPLTGEAQRIARIDRSVIVPKGSTDESPGVTGAWESSGVLDVTRLFVTRVEERVLLVTVQAHTIRDGLIATHKLGEGGQLILLRNPPAEFPERDNTSPAPPPELEPHLAAIAGLAQPSPMAKIPAGWFLMGTIRKDDDPFGLETQYDDTEFPQRRIWLDAFSVDRDEVSIGEYLAFLHRHELSVPLKLRHLIWHLIDVHVLPDYVMARWPALYVSWDEADQFCRAHGKRLLTEVEWEKAARGTDGRVFPWGADPPTADVAVFGLYHVHQIPLVAAVDSFDEGQSPYGLRHMAGNVREWVYDWYGPDSYPLMPERNPQGPKAGRYKSVRGGSWRSRPQLLRTATRNGATPDTRSPNIGFRCARTLSANPDDEIIDEAHSSDPDRAE